MLNALSKSFTCSLILILIPCLVCYGCGAAIAVLLAACAEKSQNTARRPQLLHSSGQTRSGNNVERPQKMSKKQAEVFFYTSTRTVQNSPPPQRRSENTEIHSMTKLFSKHTTEIQKYICHQAFTQSIQSTSRGTPHTSTCTVQDSPPPQRRSALRTIVIIVIILCTHAQQGNTEIHSMTKLFSKHTTIVLNEALTADLGDLFT